MELCLLLSAPQVDHGRQQDLQKEAVSSSRVQADAGFCSTDLVITQQIHLAETEQRSDPVRILQINLMQKLFSNLFIASACNV